jgi:hypothetical protein
MTIIIAKKEFWTTAQAKASAAAKSPILIGD